MHLFHASHDKNWTTNFPLCCIFSCCFFFPDWIRRYRRGDFNALIHKKGIVVVISTLKKKLNKIYNLKYQTILRHHEHFIALRTRIIRFPDFCTLLLYSTDVLTRGILERDQIYLAVVNMQFLGEIEYWIQYWILQQQQ